MPDPLDRLTLAQQKIDALFGANYAREQIPRLLSWSCSPPAC
jgi:hypothetical protein